MLATSDGSCFLYSLHTVVTGLLFIGISPKSIISGNYYKTNELSIQLLNNIFPIVYIFAAMPGSYVVFKTCPRSGWRSECGGYCFSFGQLWAKRILFSHNWADIRSSWEQCHFAVAQPLIIPVV